MGEDGELLGAWRQGDDAAGSRLVRKHFEDVLRFFRGRVPNLAEDLTQETFLQMVRARDRVDEHASFRAYLFGIARHRLLHHYRDDGRDHRRRQAEPIDARTATTSPSRHARRDERGRLVRAALEELEIDLQLTLELTYWQGMSATEVAEVIEVPQGTIKSRLRRARAALREALLRQGVTADECETTLRHACPLRAFEEA